MAMRCPHVIHKNIKHVCTYMWVALHREQNRAASRAFSTLVYVDEVVAVANFVADSTRGTLLTVEVVHRALGTVRYLCTVHRVLDCRYCSAPASL